MVQDPLEVDHESVLWKQLHEQRRDVAQLKIDQKVTETRVAEIERRYNNIIQIISESRGEAKAEYNRIEKQMSALVEKLTDLGKEISLHHGGFTMAKLLLITGIPTLGLALTAVTIFGGRV